MHIQKLLKGVAYRKLETRIYLWAPCINLREPQENSRKAWAPVSC